MIEAAEKTLDDLTLGDRFELSELVHRDALAEMTRSAEELFGIPLRLYTASGQLLADTSRRVELYEYLDKLRGGRAALQGVVAAVRRLQPSGGSVTQSCVTGAQYRITPIVYEGKAVGRMIFGPFRDPSQMGVASGLLEVDPELDAAQATALFVAMPSAEEATVVRIEKHLQATLDLLLFSGLRALLASNMHLAAVRESFRELQEKNSKLQAAYERLKELDRLKSNFLATVSHELRTPLTSIIGYSEMLKEGIVGELNDEQKEFVGTIHDKGEQLLNLIKTLLDLSKLESGTMSLRKARMQVGALVNDVVATLTPQARKKGVELSASVEDALPEMSADAERLRQVLLNLSENAIKFTPAGGTVTVAAKITTLDGPDVGAAGGVLMLPVRRRAIQLSVADTGIGISDEERSKVFDAFYQVDSSSTREQGGTGLGLSIVKRLVDAHDGTVHIYGNLPRGTVFVVTLPLAADAG